MKEANINIDTADAMNQQNTVDENQIYRLIDEEIARKQYYPIPKAKAIAAAQGNRSKLKGFYIKFRYQELVNQASLPSEFEEKTPAASEIYRIIDEEIARKEYHPKPKAQAIVEAQGNKDLIKNLYIKFRYQELFSQTEQLKPKPKPIAFEHEAFEFSEKLRQPTQRPARFFFNKWKWVCGAVIILGVLWFSSDSVISDYPVNKILPKSLQHPAIISATANKMLTPQPQVSGQANRNTLSKSAVKEEKETAFSKQAIQAIEEYRIAAEQGDAAAQFNLGLSYENGKGIAADKAQAVAWYRKAAAQKFINAQFKLAILYATGQGIAQDDRQALVLFRKVAEQGSASAQFNTGVMYETGKGVAQNKTQALAWYRKAAAQGFVDAQFNLGVIYALGQDTPKDEAQAKEWFRKAAAQGDTDAKKALLRFAK